MSDNGTEYEFTLPDGTKRYEIVFSVADMFAFKNMHNAIRARPLRHATATLATLGHATAD